MLPSISLLARTLNKAEAPHSDGLIQLHELAAGVPRVLDMLAEGALREAGSREERRIGRATVRRAWQATPLA